MAEKIDDLAKNNEKLAKLIQSLWQDVTLDPEKYRDQNISNILENMIQDEQFRVVKDFSEKWQVNENDARYLAVNYNPKKEHQVGEKELVRTENYERYKASSTADTKLTRIKYRKQVRSDFNELMQKEILPLQKR